MKTTLLAGGLLTIAVAVAPTAAADNASYLAAMHNAGVTASDADLLELSGEYCAALTQSAYGIGISPRVIAMQPVVAHMEALGIRHGSPQAHILTTSAPC